MLKIRILLGISLLLIVFLVSIAVLNLSSLNFDLKNLQMFPKVQGENIIA
jgi:hypothetical protein